MTKQAPPVIATQRERVRPAGDLAVDVEDVYVDNAEREKLQAQAYFAEYQAMMTRMNFFMSLQFTLWAPLVAFLTLVFGAYAAPLSTDIKSALFWGAAVVTQLVVLVYCFALHEVYNHAFYIETRLKPQVAELLDLARESFWAWERHLAAEGKANNPGFGDFLPDAISGLALIVAFVTAGWNWLGVLATSALLV
jgi:hypothetical protein